MHLAIIIVTTVYRFFSPLLQPDLLWGPPSLISNGYQGKWPERGAISPLPNTPSWRGAQLRKSQGQLYLYHHHHHHCNSIK